MYKFSTRILPRQIKKFNKKNPASSLPGIFQQFSGSTSIFFQAQATVYAIIIQQSIMHCTNRNSSDNQMTNCLVILDLTIRQLTCHNCNLKIITKQHKNQREKMCYREDMQRQHFRPYYLDPSLRSIAQYRFTVFNSVSKKKIFDSKLLKYYNSNL